MPARTPQGGAMILGMDDLVPTGTATVAIAVVAVLAVALVLTTIVMRRRAARSAGTAADGAPLAPTPSSGSAPSTGSPFAAPPRPTEHRLARAEAAAERAVDLLRGFRATSPAPLALDLAVAMEATVSAWLLDERIGAAEVLSLLHPPSRRPDPRSAAIAATLRSLLDGDEARAWDIATTTAAALGVEVDHGVAAPTAACVVSPGSLAGEVGAALAVGDATSLQEAAGPAGRLLLATWPARSWRLDRIPLMVSPSLAVATVPDGTPSEHELQLVLLRAVEDAARRQLAVEQALTDLQHRYLDVATAEHGGDPGEADRTTRLAGALLHRPVVSLAELAAGGDPDPWSSTVDLARRRGWTRPVVDADGTTRWLAVEVVRTAWAALSRPVPPPAPEPTIDLREAAAPDLGMAAPGGRRPTD